MSEPKRPDPSTAPASPESSGSEAAQRAARKVSGKLEDWMRAFVEAGDSGALGAGPSVGIAEEFWPILASGLRRAAAVLGAARELAETEPWDGGEDYVVCVYCEADPAPSKAEFRHTPDCPWVRLRDLLGDEER